MKGKRRKAAAHTEADLLKSVARHLRKNVEPPYAGTPLADDFPDYVTHWTPMVDAARIEEAIERGSHVGAAGNGGERG